MLKFLSASTVVVRRDGETVVQAHRALNAAPVILPAATQAGRFEIRTEASENDGMLHKRFNLVWAPLPAYKGPVQPIIVLFAFRESDEALEALAKIHAAFTRPWWRKAVRVYQVLGFVGFLMALNVLSSIHPTSRPVPASTMSSNAPSPRLSLPLTNAEPQMPVGPPAVPNTDNAAAVPSAAMPSGRLTQEQLSRALEEQREAIARQQQTLSSGPNGTTPSTIPRPEGSPAGSPAEASTTTSAAPTRAPSAGDDVLNALKGK